MLLLAPALAARTWYVPSQCPTIHAGLDSASYGDTVLVAPGTYLTTDDSSTWIRLKPGVSLVSEEGAEVTIIELCNAGIAVMFEECEEASISGFTIRFGSGPGCEYPPSPPIGVKSYNCTDIIVENCVIENLCYGIYAKGVSHEWWKPIFRNNIIRNCAYGIACGEIYDPGRPLFQDNIIRDCNSGVWVYNSSPLFEGNQIVHNDEHGMEYWEYCGGGCIRNTIAHNAHGGVYIYADPPLASPSFNGSWLPQDANDFYGNGNFDIWYDHSPGRACVMALYNYWGTNCPDFESKLHGEIYYSPWVDSTHTVILNEDDCPGATNSTTWGTIKAMFR